MLIEEEYDASDRFQTPPKSQNRLRDSFLDQVERENEELEQELKRIGMQETQEGKEEKKSEQKHYLNRIREEMDEFERELQDSHPIQPLPFKSSPSVSNLPPQSQSFSSSTSKSLETRLRGANEAVRSLTKLVKDKEKRVRELEAELEQRDKSLQLMQSQSTVASGYQKSIRTQSFSASLLKTREKDLETKVKQQEQKISDDRKTLKRLQDVNKKLILKIKESDQRIQVSTKHINPSNARRVSALDEENQKLYMENRDLKSQFRRLEQELEQEKAKFSQLQKDAVAFEGKTRDLYRANQLLNQNLVKIMNSQ